MENGWPIFVVEHLTKIQKHTMILRISIGRTQILTLIN